MSLQSEPCDDRLAADDLNELEDTVEADSWQTVREKFKMLFNYVSAFEDNKKNTEAR